MRWQPVHTVIGLGINLFLILMDVRVEVVVLLCALKCFEVHSELPVTPVLMFTNSRAAEHSTETAVSHSGWTEGSSSRSVCRSITTSCRVK